MLVKKNLYILKCALIWIKLVITNAYILVRVDKTKLKIKIKSIYTILFV
jgi:hypothetical protein